MGHVLGVSGLIAPSCIDSFSHSSVKRRASSSNSSSPPVRKNCEVRVICEQPRTKKNVENPKAGPKKSIIQTTEREHYRNIIAVTIG